jgi:RhoGAP domain
MCFKQVVDVLPPGCYAILQTMFRFFKKVVAHADQSKMNAHNMAIVFAPSILRPDDETVESLTDEEPARIIADLVTEVDLFFPKGERKIGDGPDWLLGAAPMAPKFAAEFERGKAALHAALVEERQREGVAPPTDLTVDDLVDLLIDGETDQVDDFIGSQPKGHQNEMREAVLARFQVRMQLKGIISTHGSEDESSASPSAPKAHHRRGTVFARHVDSVSPVVPAKAALAGPLASSGDASDEVGSIAPELVAKLMEKDDNGNDDDDDMMGTSTRLGVPNTRIPSTLVTARNSLAIPEKDN